MRPYDPSVGFLSKEACSPCGTWASYIHTYNERKQPGSRWDPEVLLLSPPTEKGLLNMPTSNGKCTAFRSLSRDPTTNNVEPATHHGFPLQAYSLWHLLWDTLVRAGFHLSKRSELSSIQLRAFGSVQSPWDVSEQYVHCELPERPWWLARLKNVVVLVSGI